jgi:hypothetical protein
MTTKKEKYLALVQKRKLFQFQVGLRNPSETEFDTIEIEPWANWQNDLDAEILVIGQEFCDFDTFNKTKGKVEQFEDKFEYQSNKNLRKLLSSIGKDPGNPLHPKKDVKLFFTNCVMGLKEGDMSANFMDKWMKPSRENFLTPLVDLIQPKIIVCIGSKAAESVSKMYNFKMGPLKEMILKNPIEIDQTKIFSMYHTGGLGIRNRSFELQLKDWQQLIKWL